MPVESTARDQALGATLRSDALASIVVFLAALPLCMGVALASGAPIATGLITGIVGGLVVGWIAGSPLQVSGPAAGLTVVVYDIIQQFGLEMLGLVVLLAGLIQLIAGALRLGQWFRAVSPAVIKGMLAGIGLLILGSQFHVMIDDKPKGGGATNLATIPQAIVKAIGWSDFGDSAARQFRTETLKQVGELHRRQVLVQEHLAEYAPHGHVPAGTHIGSHSGAPPATTAAPPKRSAELIERLSAEQRSISQQLASVAEEIQKRQQQQRGDSEKQSLVELATLQAVAANEEAVNSLAGDSLDEMLTAQANARKTLESLLDQLKNHHLAAYIGILTIVLIVLWQSFAPAKLRAVPAPLVAVVIATIVSAALVLPVIYVEVPDRLWDEIRFPTWVVVENAPWAELFYAAMFMAIVASAETLLCATAVDQLHRGPRTRYDQELMAQGIGNTLCGLLGALPMTGVIVRSSANIQAGGQTRMSAILHGLWLLLFVAALSFLLRMIPTACLAAILVYTGYKLIDPKSLKALWKVGPSEVAIYAATVFVIVFEDLLMGVVVGIVLSALKLLYTFSKLRADLSVDYGAQKAKLRLYGAATFIRLPQLASTLERVPAEAELHVDLKGLDYIDHACLELLANWSQQHEATGGKLIMDWDWLRSRFEAGSAAKPTPPGNEGA